MAAGPEFRRLLRLNDPGDAFGYKSLSENAGYGFSSVRNGEKN